MLRVILAGIFSLIFPGIGQIFNGQWLKGLAFVLVELSIIYFIIPNTWITILFRLIWLYAIIDAIVFALRARKDFSKSKGLTGIKAIAGVGISMLLILPIAWLPKFIPDIIYSLAARSHQIMEQNVPEGQFEEEVERYKDYLENKYDEKFVLGEGSYNTTTKHYIIDAYPEGNEEVLFRVFQDEKDQYYDTYIRTKWEVEAKERFDPFIQSLYGDMWTYDLEIVFKTYANDIILEENDVLPSFEESTKRYDELYHYGVKIHVIRDINDENKQEELNRMYQVINFFEEYGIKVGRYEVSYYNEKLQEKIEDDTLPDSGKHHDYKELFLSVSQNQIDEITSPGDIEQYLVDLRNN